MRSDYNAVHVRRSLTLYKPIPSGIVVVQILVVPGKRVKYIYYYFTNTLNILLFVSADKYKESAAV